MKYALDELITVYRKSYPAADAVQVSYGSIGNFYTQMQNGAPFTLFLSADSSYPKMMEDASLVVRGTRREYAIGRVVVWVAKGSPVDVEKLGPAVLIDQSIEKIAIANPDHTPYGKAALSLLNFYKIKTTVFGKFVLGENIVQAA